MRSQESITLVLHLGRRRWGISNPTKNKPSSGYHGLCFPNNNRIPLITQTCAHKKSHTGYKVKEILGDPVGDNMNESGDQAQRSLSLEVKKKKKNSEGSTMRKIY